MIIPDAKSIVLALYFGTVLYFLIKIMFDLSWSIGDDNEKQ